MYIYLNYNFVKNTVELLRSRLQNLNLKFRKFLQNQSEFIKEKIKRINNLTGAHTSTLSNKKSHNEFIYTSIPNKEESDEIIEINSSFSTQTTMQTSSNRNQYYLDRTNSVQTIEKTMNELSQMFFRLGQMVNEQKSMIEKIDNNTDLSVKNVEEGLQELTHMQRDVRSNRKLLLKIFFILIATAVIYIILFT
jgi:syntaxin 5